MHPSTSKRKLEEELPTKLKRLKKSNNGKASEEAMLHKEQELYEVQDGLHHQEERKKTTKRKQTIEENNKNKKAFRLRREYSREKDRNAAQKSSSAKFQSVSCNKKEIKSPSPDNQLEDRLRPRQVSTKDREILIAAGRGHVEKAENLIQQGSVDIDFADRDGNTAPHYAAESSNYRLRREYSQGKVRNAAQKSSSARFQSVSGKKKEVKSPFHDNQLKERLRARQVSVNNRELLIAAGRGDLRKAENLIQQGSVDVDFADRDGNTALHYAVESSSLEIINLLIKSNAKIDVENEQCETAFDVAVRLKKEVIFKGFEKKIVDEAFKILEKANKITETTSTAPQKSSKVELENTEVEKKINGLLELLKQDESGKKKEESGEKKDESGEKKDESGKKEEESGEKKDESGEKKDESGEKKYESGYKTAMIFILFLETFAFQGLGGRKGKDKRKELRKTFFKDSERNNTIEEYRSLFLKSKEKNYVFNDINSVIDSNTFNKCLGDQLFRYMENKKEKIEIDALLLNRPFDKKSIGSEISPDPYGNLIVLVNEIYKKDADLHKQWFEFISNIYPKLEGEKGSSDLRKEIDHLRNNLIHSFYKFGVFEFREAVFNLRGKLVVYSYAKQVYKCIIDALVDKNPAEIENKLKKQLEKVKKKFVATEELSSEAADQLFGYRVEKCLYLPLANKLSQQTTLRGLVIDYWRYLLPIDLVVAEYVSNNEFKDKNDFEKLNGVSRRKLFEKFLALKRHKLVIPGSYNKAKEIFKKEVIEYGCSPSCFDQICRRNFEHIEELDNEIEAIVEKILKFISITLNAKEILDHRQDSFISFARDILEVQDEHVKKLVLTQSNSINRMKEKLERAAESNEKIRQLMELKKDLREIFIEENEGRIETVDKTQVEQNMKLKKVTDAVINIVETLYNAYNEYKVDFNLKEIFSSRNFLNELVEKIEDNNIPLLIDRLIDIDYMSPLVSSLIVKQSKKKSNKKVTNDIILEKLIDNMLAVKEYADYLKDLLQVNCYKFNFYKEFYNKILEKHIDIQDISPIFKEPNNIKEFIGVLVSDKENVFKEPNAVMEKKDQIMKLVMSLLEIINKEIADEYYYKKNYLSQVIEDSKKLYNFKKEIGKAYPQFSGFADMKILEAKIKNKEGKFEEALNILKKLEKKLENNDSLKISYLLTLSDIAYTYNLQKEYARSKEKHTVLYFEIIKHCLKLDTKVEEIDYKLYKTVKDLNEYKSLLQHSELLHSEKRLNILNILLDIAYIIFKSGNEEEALEIYQEVYRFRKKDNDNKTIQVLGYIASRNREIGNKHRNNNQYSDALCYYLKALFESSIVYNGRKELLGDNHIYVSKTAEQISKTLKVLASTNNTLGCDYFKKSKERQLESELLNKAFEHYRKAEEIYKEVIDYQIKVLGEESAVTKQTRQNLDSTKEESADRGSNDNKTIQLLGDISSTSREIGYMHNEQEHFSDALCYYLNTLKKYTKVYTGRKQLLGDNHKCVLKTAEQIIRTLKDLAFTSTKLAQLKLSLNLSSQAFEHYSKAEKIYEGVRDFQIEILGAENDETKKTIKNLNLTTNWKNRVIVEENAET